MDQNANHFNRKIRQEIILIDDMSDDDTSAQEIISVGDCSTKSIDFFDEDASVESVQFDEDASDEFEVDEDALGEEPEGVEIVPSIKRTKVSEATLLTMLTANLSVSTQSSSVATHQPIGENRLGAATLTGKRPLEAMTSLSRDDTFREKDDLPGSAWAIDEDDPPIPDCFNPYLMSLPDRQREACKNAMKPLVDYIDGDVSAKTLLDMVKEAPRYALQGIFDSINKIRAKERKTLQCKVITHAKDDVAAYLGQLLVCLLICTDSAPVKDQLMFWEWDVVLAAKKGLETIKSKCTVRAPDFIYVENGKHVTVKNDFLRLMEALAWAHKERPELRIVIESKAGTDDPKGLLEDLEDKLGMRFFPPLHIPVYDGGPPVVTSFWISDWGLYRHLCAFSHLHAHAHSVNSRQIAQLIALYVSAECELVESSRVGPPKSRQLSNRRMTENKLDRDSSKSSLNDDTHKFRKSYDEQCTYRDVKLMLGYRVDLWQDEVTAAWIACQSTIGPQTTLNDVRKKALEVKRTGTYTHNSDTWQPRIGLKVRRLFGMEYFVGEVVGEGTIDIDGEPEKIWRVKYEDGDEEDLNYRQLIQFRQNRHRVPYAVIGRPFRFCELFCGSGVVTEYFSRKLFDVMSIDCDPKSNATHVMNILNLTRNDVRVTEHLGGMPDFIWASPPCLTYSVLSAGKHRKKSIWNKTLLSLHDDFLLLKTLHFMRAAKKVNPHLIVVIENPVGLLDESPIMIRLKEELDLHTVRVNYCAFGRDEKKSTHLWTNDSVLAYRLSKYTCKKCCPVSDENGKQCGRKHKGSVRDDKDRCHQVIPEPLALLVARYAAARFEANGIRHHS